MLDQYNRAYLYTGERHEQIPVAITVELVFDGIEEMGWTSETVHDEEFVAEEHRKFREAGWTVITTATPGSAQLFAEPGKEEDASREA